VTLAIWGDFTLDCCNLQAVSSRSQEAADMLQLILDSQMLSIEQTCVFADASLVVSYWLNGYFRYNN
jgi:hypothetical protein